MAVVPEREWTVGELVEECQLVDWPGQAVSTKRIRLMREVLVRLADVGVVACRATGEWVFVPEPVADLRERDTTWGEVVEQVAIERRAYRSGGTGGWQVARAAAIKRDRTRQQAWWAGLSLEERSARQIQYAIRFARWSVEEQYRFKVVAAQRSTRQGVSPAVRHQRWIYEMDPDDLDVVAVERSARFAALPQPLQVAYVRAWEAYRYEFGVPRGSWQVGSRRRDQTPSLSEQRRIAATP